MANVRMIYHASLHFDIKKNKSKKKKKSNFTEISTIPFQHYSHPLNFCKTKTWQKRCLKHIDNIILYAIKTSFSRNLEITNLHDFIKTKTN